MNRCELRAVGAVAIMALLSACGGGDPAAQAASSAALVVHSPAPLADCEAEGCNQPRIVDGLAEQYRANAQPAEPAEPAQQAPAPGGSAPAAAG